uniref:Uncharacterized protein n=1 Tax=Panagrolaimus davidi TaxID=227884 RepID=A0A914QBH7_9BILA
MSNRYFFNNDKRIIRAAHQKAAERKKAYDSLNKEFSENRQKAAPVHEMIIDVESNDLRYKFLSLKLQKLEDRAIKIYATLLKMKADDRKAAEEAEKIRKEDEDEKDVYTDDEEGALKKYPLFMKLSVPARRSFGQSADNNQESSGFGSHQGFRCRGPFGQSTDNNQENSGFASRGGFGSRVRPQNKLKY